MQIPAYAFPLGFQIKRESQQPKFELLPMAFLVGDECHYMQYLIFYESLEEHYLNAYKLFDEAQNEMDRIDFDDSEVPKP
jgi:hypothetical protein